LPIEKQISKTQEKSDAQFDREQLDRVRQKLAKQDKKKPVVLDADDDEDEDQQTNSKLSYINLERIENLIDTIVLEIIMLKMRLND